MPTAGYSGTPLDQKLGLRAGLALFLCGDRDGLASVRAVLPRGLRPLAQRSRAPCDLIVFAVRAERELRSGFPRCAARLQPAGALWVAWPKLASGIPSDLSEGVVRTTGVRAGLVDVKVCAIDAQWSGLKFVRRLADRPKAAGTRARAAGSKGSIAPRTRKPTP